MGARTKLDDCYIIINSHEVANRDQLQVVIFIFQVWDLSFTVYMVYIFVMHMCYI